MSRRVQVGRTLQGGRTMMGASTQPSVGAMSDSPRSRKDALRTCIVSRKHAHPEHMIRFVAGPQGVVTPDIRAKLPGRGVWVLARRELIGEAARKNLFARGLKVKASTPGDLPDQVDRLLLDDCLKSLSMANKAGLVVVGFEKAERCLASGQARAGLHAADGGVDGRRKLRQAASRATEGAAPQIMDSFDSAQLSLALGRANVIHAALKPGPASFGFLARVAKLQNYRDASVDDDHEFQQDKLRDGPGSIEEGLFEGSARSSD